jgi:hypothetical protein
MGYIDDYVKRRLSAADLEAELLSLISQYNQMRDTFALLYVTAMIKPTIPDIALGQDDYYIIHDLVRGVDSPRLDFYVETPGGRVEAAEEIVRCLRGKFDQISCVVSGEAKSAGTIMVLSGDEILMTETGSLGPIDAQVKIGRYVASAHDYVEWTEEKRKEAAELGRLNPFDATMIAQISPGEMSGVYHTLKFTEDLVVPSLVKYKFKNWTVTETRKKPVTEEMKTRRAKAIAAELENHTRWRSHGRSIKADDLEDIGLKVTRVEKDPRLSDTVFRIQTVCRLLFTTTNTYKIFATEKDKVFKQASAQKPPGIPSKAPSVVEFDPKCPQCGKVYKLYAKFVAEPRIDQEFQAKGRQPYPKDNKLRCTCGFEINLSGLRNDIETKTGKKLLV